MKTNRVWGSIRAQSLVAVVGLAAFGSCGAPPGGRRPQNNNSTPQRNLRVAFTSSPDGMFALATDEDGNQITANAARGQNGMRVTEFNVRTQGGMVVKASVDDRGNPVNLRGSDGTNANVLVKSGSAKVVLDGQAPVDNLDVARALPNARASSGVRSQPGNLSFDLFSNALGSYSRVAVNLFSSSVNPNSPLVGTSLEEPCLALANFFEVLDVSLLVEIGELEPVIAIDEIYPVSLNDLRGTWVLCARSDFPSLIELGIENRLTFGTVDEPYRLVTEFDDQNVFSLTRGVTINYADGATVTQTAGGVTLELTPVYTATSLDSFGDIVVERRFLGVVSDNTAGFGIPDVFQWNAALDAGQIGPDGVLTFTLNIIDLENDSFEFPPVTLSYVREGEPLCTSAAGGPSHLAVVCPAGLYQVGDTVRVSVDTRAFISPDVEWYVLSGDAFFANSFSAVTDVFIADDFEDLRLAVAVLDLADGKYADGECIISVLPGVSDICEQNGWYNDAVCDDFCPLPDPDCDAVIDICAANGWYGDGECDTFCPLFDELDCTIVTDMCAELGWYGDGICDECPEPDPDCFGGPVDVCAENDYYGDGVCDTFCLEPDPDCQAVDICAENGYYGDGFCDDFCPLFDELDCQTGTGDVCEENGYYNDGICDDFCPEPDPDCGTTEDVCALNGWYNDGVCDTFCPMPDPDCGF